MSSFIMQPIIEKKRLIELAYRLSGEIITPKKEDKDYIARVSVSPDLDLDKHKSVFAEFVEKEIH